MPHSYGTTSTPSDRGITSPADRDGLDRRDCVLVPSYVLNGASLERLGRHCFEVDRYLAQFG